MVMCSLYLRQCPLLWRMHVYLTKHPCLYMFTVVGVVVFGLVIFRTFCIQNDASEQVVVDYIAEYVDVRLQVLDNFRMTVSQRVPMTVTLKNTGVRDIFGGPWRIYFNSLHGEYDETLNCSMEIVHVLGGLFYLAPEPNVVGSNLIPAGKSLICLVNHKVPTVSRTDHMPKWYVLSENGNAAIRIIKSTTSEDLTHIGLFDKPNLWKRSGNDIHVPYTPKLRFQKNLKINNESQVGENLVLPTPKSITILSSSRLILNNIWAIAASVYFKNEVNYLTEKLKLTVKTGGTKNVVKILRAHNGNFDAEEYELKIDSAAETIYIFANDPSGAFYGIQTLLSLLREDQTLPSVLIRDKPRFHFRGLMIDVSRNFRSKQAIKEMIEVMATYKMNKLHLHLSDDEGWRIEIPEIPELTEVGSKRCHSNKGNICLIPSLGSGPFSFSSGSGFYTVSDYKEILKYAAERHVQIIPEIDMPGHAMAAVFSMKFRDSVRNRYGDHFHSYLLTDSESSAESVQNWVGNSINPCLNTTFAFVNQVVDSLITLHKGIQDLTLLHIGGDEVAFGAWDGSSACKKLFKGTTVDHADVKKLFVYTVADLLARKGLNIGSWEDGMYHREERPYPRADLKPNEVYVNPWNNIWESGRGGRAYNFADEGYKVILSFGTILYFDHPYEPDPEERGLYWATRYTDTEAVYGFMPDDIFANAVTLSSGKPTTREEICGHRTCPTTGKPENIIGIQACVWSELIRTDEQMQEMLLPRLLAVAERSWHKAQWEDIQDESFRNHVKSRDFTLFVNHLGQKELPRLEKMGISYRLPIPGAMVADGKVYVNSMYPNHKILYSIDDKTRWIEVKGDHFNLPNYAQRLYIKTQSKISHKTSRAILVFGKNGAIQSHGVHIILALMCILTCLQQSFFKID